MIVLPKSGVVSVMSASNPPVARCGSGDTVRFETRDAYNDQLAPDGTTLPGDGAVNPATGPLYIEGAQPGDVLAVSILAIRLAPTALMRTSPTAGAFNNIEQTRVTAYDVTGTSVQFSDRLRLPLRPMIGVIGTAPTGDGIDTFTPGSHGGNMDCKEITEGTRLYLPVNVPGALLALGDLHALMGDGESLICGMEVGGAVTVRVEVLKGPAVQALPTPALVGHNRFATIQSAPTLDQAAPKAARQMQAFLMRAAGMDAYESGRLLSVAGDLAICQIVDPWMTVRMSIELSILAQLGIQLP